MLTIRHYHQISWDDASAVEREVKKFKDVFSKSVYSDLLSKIDNANASLKTLIEQSHHRQENRRKHRVSKKPLLKYKAARKHASNLYNAVVRGKYWKCPCKESHCVHLRIGEPSEALDDHESAPGLLKFRMAFSTKVLDPLSTTSWLWEEVESIPELLELPAVAQKAITSTSYTTGHEPVTDKKVQFAVVTTALQSLPWPKVPNIPPILPIPDFCSVLCKISASGSLTKYMGSISPDDSDASHRYCFYLMDKHEKSVETRSLEDLLGSSLHNTGTHGTRPAFRFSRRDRLYLAATLASSTLQFYGSWLQEHWRSRDILFPQLKDGAKSQVENPYLAGHAVSESKSGPAKRTITNPLIANDVLFPLGLVLVELSLCQSIAALRVPEDEDVIEAYANLKTATRLLDERVYSESGCKYGDVVNSCFRWSETRNSTADDEDFQELVFHKIVLPLIEDLKDFEGKGRIH